MANEEVIELVEETEQSNPSAAYIVNITYFPDKEEYEIGKKRGKKTHESDLPESCIFDIPPKIFEMREKNRAFYQDVVETFIYNTISKKFGREVAHCQIYLADM